MARAAAMRFPGILGYGPANERGRPSPTDADLPAQAVAAFFEFVEIRSGRRGDSSPADSHIRLQYDAMRYGRAGIPETWLVDVPDQTVTVYTGPAPDGYAREQVLRCGDRIVAMAIAELGFPVDDVFG